MSITVTDAASQWFKSELDLPATGAAIRFFGKVYGKTNVHDGFSVGMTRDDHPTQVITETEKDGVRYVVSDSDAWFFSNLNLTVDFDAAKDEPKYIFEKA